MVLKLTLPCLLVERDAWFVHSLDEIKSDEAAFPATGKLAIAINLMHLLCQIFLESDTFLLQVLI